MKNRLAKIFSFLSLAVYCIMLLAFLLGQLDNALDYNPANSPLLNILKSIGDFSTFVFMFTLCLGWLAVLPFSIAGIVFSLLSRNEHRAKACFYGSAISCCFALPWAVIIGSCFLIFHLWMLLSRLLFTTLRGTFLTSRFRDRKSFFPARKNILKSLKP